MGEHLPQYTECKYSCNPPDMISPGALAHVCRTATALILAAADSGNRKSIWPKCPHPDNDCHSQCSDAEPRSCPNWVAAYDGFGCQDNPGFMLTQCMSSCNVCHLDTNQKRCVELDDHPPALKPGDMDRMFNRLTTELTDLNTTTLSRDPWVVLVHRFLEEDEIEHLLQPRKFQVASDTGAAGKDGRSTMKFSSQRKTDVHWCNTGCSNQPPVQKLMSRISELTMVHQDHFESMQLLRYHKGFYYKAHNDNAGGQQGTYTGGRVYTAFLYLNDVEEGGETQFPRLKFKVKPERGSLLLWPSVKSDNPSEIDTRTLHEALPVVKGQKFSANVWIEQGPFQSAHNLGCANTPIARDSDYTRKHNEL
jgi:prolyl 4-hydroxylase